MILKKKVRGKESKQHTNIPPNPRHRSSIHKAPRSSDSAGSEGANNSVLAGESGREGVHVGVVDAAHGQSRRERRGGVRARDDGDGETGVRQRRRDGGAEVTGCLLQRKRGCWLVELAFKFLSLLLPHPSLSLISFPYL